MERRMMRILEDYGKEYYFARVNKIMRLVDSGAFIEIMINSHDEVFVEGESGIVRLESYFESQEDYLEDFAHFMSINNKTMNLSKPIIDFEIRSAYRVNVVGAHLSQSQPVITMRKLGGTAFTYERLLGSGFFTKSQAKLLHGAVESGKNIFISGGTSTGKTTLLNYLLTKVGEGERLVIIEDTSEIRAPSSLNVAYLRTRIGEYKVKGVSTGDLIKTSLRMRPDRIILGEIRREEAVDFLHAINSGHGGSICTGHGSSPMDMLNRLEMLLMESGLPREAVRTYLGRGIDLIVQLTKEGGRRIDSMSSVSLQDGDLVIRAYDHLS